MTALRTWSGAALAAGLATAWYAIGVEPYRLQLTHAVLPCPRLPAALDGLSVLLLADLHTSEWGRREQLLAQLLDALPTPDIAVLAGDLIHGASGIRVACDLVDGHVRARHARYGILGNAEHKLRWRRRDQMVDELERAGLTLLINQNEPLTINNTTITVAGTNDPYYGHADLEATLRDTPPDRFCLLLAHSPQIALLAARAGVDVMLSGHTHGGQVRLPLLGPLKTQNPLGRAVDAGLFDRARLARAVKRDPGGDLLIYVSRGIGVARFHLLPLYPRLFCRPEVAWLTLQRSP